MGDEVFRLTCKPGILLRRPKMARRTAVSHASASDVPHGVLNTIDTNPKLAGKPLRRSARNGATDTVAEAGKPHVSLRSSGAFAEAPPVLKRRQL